jgi:hypothetical protein
MIVPGWITMHVIGYGLASGIILGAGGYALHEHDAKVRAEVQAQERAKAATDADTLRTRMLEAAVAAVARRVDTQTVVLKPIIQRTNTIIDSARRRPTDTALVQRALNLADTSSAKCSELILTCDLFKRMATDSIKALVNLVGVRDHELLVAVTPSSPRLSFGLSAGVGYCVPLAPPYGGKPCVAAIAAGHLRIF